MIKNRGLGIYKIQHKISGRVYIGSSKNVFQRLACHRAYLRGKTHVNAALQNAFNKYGDDAFSFEVILMCERKDLLFYEQSIMDGYNSYTKPFGYNLRKKAESNIGMRPGSQKYKAGDKFNRLTLVSRADDKRWNMKCDCGKEVTSFLNGVTRGRILSCGCAKTDALFRSRKHKSGDKFGYLTLVNLSKINKRGTRFWIAKCYCGSEKEYHISGIAYSKHPSCGCMKGKNISKNKSIMIDLFGEKMNCIQADKRLGNARGCISSWALRNEKSYQESVDYYAAKKTGCSPQINSIILGQLGIAA